MSETWIPYVRASGKTPLGGMVNVGLRPLAGRGDPDRPSLTLIHVAFKDPDQHGMGTQEDANRIDDRWITVVDALANHRAIFVARLRRSGRMTFCVYAPSDKRTAIERAIQPAFLLDEVKYEHRDDRRWEAFKSVLPTSEEERSILDLQVIQVLEQHGDPLTPARDVRHYAYFAEERPARDFAAAQEPHGFTVELNPPDHKAPQWSVVLSRDDSVAPEAITPLTSRLSEHARALGGEYDGWEAALVKPKGVFARIFGKK
jgi:hypothetical protein